ncbi:histidine phosphatase family protein [Sinorhizobium sp. RAC02]|uniref:SixA phosphatase family protein n=1 Tax=Sinorhizobium sp. RAC02 TaxID=1842534 RepID=UPI00083CF922|nr:histidine phosphatase family protein [Sinorhizobium sp. RAC02]AOF89738.1 histidine phosphatase super family protein [Sinorhizobium sp. RAC02]
MKRLLLLRHAKSAWPEGVEDHDRPLGDRGRRDAPRMGAYIASAGLQPDFGLVSSARRTQETWALVEQAFAKPCRSRTVPSIYEAEPAAIRAAIQAAPEESKTLLVIGHNPGFENLAALLAPDGDGDALARLRTKYPTAGLAVIVFDVERWENVAPGTGRLEGFVTPKTLP